MKITPLFDRVVVKEIEHKETETAGGILLPTSAQERPCIAQVIAVGEGGIVDGNEIKMILKVGDKVLYNKFTASEFKLDGETVFILKQDDILAKVE